MGPPIDSYLQCHKINKQALLKWDVGPIVAQQKREKEKREEGEEGRERGGEEGGGCNQEYHLKKLPLTHTIPHFFPHTPPIPCISS